MVCMQHHRSYCSPPRSCPPHIVLAFIVKGHTLLRSRPKVAHSGVSPALMVLPHFRFDRSTIDDARSGVLILSGLLVSDYSTVQGKPVVKAIYGSTRLPMILVRLGCAVCAFCVAWWLPQVRQFGPEALWILQEVRHNCCCFSHSVCIECASGSQGIAVSLRSKQVLHCIWVTIKWWMYTRLECSSRWQHQ